MKETTVRKTIMKQSKDLKQVPLTGLKSAMSAPRKQIKEGFVPRTVSHRYTELPSLRYGASPNQTASYCSRESGPLKVSVSCENAKKKVVVCGKSNGGCPTSVGCHSNCTGNSLPSYNVDAPPVRRVHFAELPPKSNSFTDFSGVREKMRGESEEAEERAENWMRSKVGIPCIDGGSVSSSSRSARHGLPSAPSGKLLRLGNNGNVHGGTIYANPATLKTATRGHDTAKYRHGTLVQSSGPQVSAVLKAAKNASDEELSEVLRKASLFGISPEELNASDASGRTALSHIASNGTLSNLKAILHLPKLDVNKPDNEGNTPLHFAAQAGRWPSVGSVAEIYHKTQGELVFAGQVEAINYMLSVCTGLEVDARNALGFTPLMKAALQGRTKCAKLLLFAGASPTLRDSGRGLRAEQWAKYCGRYVCADVIEKFTRHKLLDRNTSYGRWGSEPELADRINTVKPSQSITIQNSSSIKTKIRKAFRTMSHPGSDACGKPFSVVSQLTSAALCASSPVLQSSVSPSVKSLMRPLSVPKVQVTLASNCAYGDDLEPHLQHSSSETSVKEKSATSYPTNRIKKKK